MEQHPSDHEHEAAANRADEGGGVRRSEFLKRALGAGGAALSFGSLGSLLAACGGNSGSASTSAGGGGGGSGKPKVIAIVDQAVDQAHQEWFIDPTNLYIKAKAPSWKSVNGNENNTVPTGLQLARSYQAANYPVLVLATGDEMSAWETTVKQVAAKGMLVFNHAPQAVTGATQNVLFSHKQAGVDIGHFAVTWCKKNGIDAPVVGLIGYLTNNQAKKRTEYAYSTIKSAFPNAKQAGAAVNALDTPGGAKAAGNLISAHPDMNILITFNGDAGVGAFNACKQAGKTDPSKFLLATTDSVGKSIDLVAAGGSVYQANWGAYFPQSTILIVKDAIAQVQTGKKARPTRLILGQTITTPEAAKAFKAANDSPLDPKYDYVYTKYFRYLDTVLKTAQVPPGQ